MTKKLLALVLLATSLVGSVSSFAQAPNDPMKDRVAATCHHVRQATKSLLAALTADRVYCVIPALEEKSKGFVDAAKKMHHKVRKADTTHEEIKDMFVKLETEWFEINRQFSCNTITSETHAAWTDLFAAFGELRDMVGKL